MGLERLILDRQKLRSFNKASEELRWLELGHISPPKVKEVLKGYLIKEGFLSKEDITSKTQIEVGGSRKMEMLISILNNLKEGHFTDSAINDKTVEVKEMLFDKPSRWSYRNAGMFVKKRGRGPQIEGSRAKADIGYGGKEIDSLSPDQMGLSGTINIIRPVPQLLQVRASKDKKEQLARLTDQFKSNIGTDYTITREGDREVSVREFLLDYGSKASYVAQSLEVDGLVNGRYQIIDVNSKLKK